MSGFEAGRFERKYVVTETAAAAIRQFVLAYMIPDPYMDPAERRGYRVRSLYLDSLDLALYRLTAEGIKNRYKLRIRFYSEHEEEPAFLEIKYRITDTIKKERAVVRRPAVGPLLRGQAVSPDDVISLNAASVHALAGFCERQARLNALGSVFVSYWREAYVLPDAGAARVTLDRGLVAHPHQFDDGLTLRGDGIPAGPGQVVLELKYSGRAPGWMKDLVNAFGLQRGPFPKYVYCIDALQRARAIAG